MSPSAYITKRQTKKSGPRYVVRFRPGGRFTKLTHAGSFRTLGPAKLRRDFVIGELAAGRNPLETLRAMREPETIVTLDQQFGLFIESRVDVSDKTVALYRNARARLGKLADRNPATLRPADFQLWVADNSDLATASLGHYLSSVRQVLDFADVEPNPARSRKVKLPTSDTEEVDPPSSKEWKQIERAVGKTWSLVVRLKECCAFRTKELRELTYGDVDFAESRIRVSRARTKRRTAGQRWVPVPKILLDEISELVPLEDRHHARRVFPALGEHTLRGVLTRACRDAGVAHYPPHQLRHRRCSLWLRHGIDEVTAASWSGHSKPSMLLDVYGHVMVDPSGDVWRDFWIDTYREERLPATHSVVPMRSEEET